MIYFIINETYAEESDMHRFYAYSHPIATIPLQFFHIADFVLYFDENGNTVYYKNRFFDEYQYSDEEKVVLKLKSVLV